MRTDRAIQGLIVLAGVGVFVYMLTQNLPKSQGKGVIAVTVVVCMALLWLVSWHFDRKRRQELGEALSRMGFVVGNGHEARFVRREVKGERSLEGTFWASAPDESMGVAEFKFVTGRGKHSQTHRYVQVWRLSPGRWPDLWLSKRLSFMRRPFTDLIGNQDFGLENEQFTKRWTIECVDREFVVLMLNPQVQEWLMRAPKEEGWEIAEGRVCVTRRGKKYAGEVEAMVARMDEFLQMLPGELAAYETARTLT